MADPIVYTYRNCSTCRKALKWLEAHGRPFEERPIREQPPSRDELHRALATHRNIRQLLNTSSQDYRDAGLKDTLNSLPAEDVFERLQHNGNLVKRPFVVLPDIALAGFKEDLWRKHLL